MAGQAQQMREQLRREKAKKNPNPDVLYYLEQALPYANIIDTDRMRRGREALRGGRNDS